MFGTSLSLHLVQRALEGGIQYATLTLGHAGFVPGAKQVAVDMPDLPSTTLPTCVELVGSPAVLDSFVEANREDLANAVLLRLEGVNVSLRGRQQ
ncbi:MAG: DUF190 domain-containing protein [Myxococcaceae bacterium]